jgi:hypothetical protein
VPPSFEECGNACDGRQCGLNGRFVVCPGGGYGDAFCTGGLGYYDDECGCASTCATPTPA